tara:strand:- start:672 stop:980 length:309 start_codon:yes stop_codon:yes gene_type:complete
MVLTGKCKEEFERWFAKKSKEDQYWYVGYNKFELLPDSMQYGVYVDFFDSVGLFIEIANDNKEIKTFWLDINDKEIDDVELNSRPEARTTAIEKANELYNNK